MDDSGRLIPDAIVERCDLCCRFGCDADARAKLVELGLDDPPQALASYTVHCFAVVRVTFPGLQAASAKEAAQRAMDRLDWATHGGSAEYADEIQGTLVDVDGDDDHKRTVEFDGELGEVRR
jgi:hypothetical protein